MDDCVRGRQGREPSRTARQFGQLQFHWGKPPPAADPSTRTHTDALHSLSNNSDQAEAQALAASRAGKDGSTIATPARTRAGVELY
jgi:hypothetical protein